MPPQTMKVVVGLLCLAVAMASRTVMEKNAGIPGVYNGWKIEHRAHPDDLVNLFSLRIAQIDSTQVVQALEDTLLRVSDPRHPDYGKHLSMEQVNALVAPKPESVAAVRNWLLANGVSEDAITNSSHSDFIRATVSVRLAEQLLATEYHLHSHHSSKATLIRCQSYSVPSDIAPHLDFVGPTIRLPRVRSARIRRDQAIRMPRRLGHSNDVLVTPAFLRALYNADKAVGKAKNNVQAHAQFLEQYWSNADLQEFFLVFSNKSIGRTAKQFGPNNDKEPGPEASLDVQYIMAVGEGVETWAWYTPGRAPPNPENEPFLEWMMNVSSTTPLPNVISVSYGEDEKSVGFDYAARINAEFQKAGVRGVSLLFASGDDGVGGNCTGTRMSPDYPADSPWVTAVGGVFAGNVSQTPTGEITDPISGGGFSDWFPRPAYQNDAVDYYLKNAKGLPPAKNFNQSGRAYPDVAAQSEFFLVVMDRIPLPVSGTSCASPTFAGIVGLLNDIRIGAGKPPLGFLNPLLYQTGPKVANAFNDITLGGNLGCIPIIEPGFPAWKMWDAATGWGSPNYAVLSQVVKSLP